jgi:hypothetical protein
MVTVFQQPLEQILPPLHPLDAPEDGKGARQVFAGSEGGGRV